MTDHPCKGMTSAQKAAFELIAINQHPYCATKTIDALIAKGLVSWNEKCLGRDALGSIMVREYSVPLWAHAQWCKWASEQPDMPL
jgi:hypothetical protein